MSSPALAELMAFDRLYGFPDVYFMTGAICATLQGLLSEKPKRIGEIIPFFAAEMAPMSGDEMATRVMMMAAQQRGKT